MAPFNVEIEKRKGSQKNTVSVSRGGKLFQSRLMPCSLQNVPDEEMVVVADGDGSWMKTKRGEVLVQRKGADGGKKVETVKIMPGERRGINIGGVKVKIKRY